jgi:4-amino-4-deoxy-L-arabinose transferase-like glycosyltransferase
LTYHTLPQSPALSPLAGPVTSRRSGERAILPWPALLGGLVVLFLAANARWIWLYRHAQPLDIDEAGYLGIALRDYRAWLAGGAAGWLGAVEGVSIHAPLATALASLVFAAVGPHVVAGFTVPVLAAAACVLAGYGLARTLAPPAAAFAVAALVATCPIVLVYARSFHFAMPATVVMTFALLGLARSARFARPGWAALFGVSLGLLPLARTMTIAFVPGLVLAAAIHAAAGGDRPLRRLAVLGGALLLAALTAGAWLVPNRAGVFGYLLSFGYGHRAAEFGPRQGFLGLEAWAYTARSFATHVYLPHALVLLAGALALPVVLLGAVRRRGAMGLGRALLRSPALPVAVSMAEVLTALTSSQNKGSAFMARWSRRCSCSLPGRCSA